MNKNLLALGIGAFAFLALSPSGSAQRSAPAKPKVTSSNAETGLAGIKLFDSGTRVVALFGSPTSVEAVSVNSQSAGPGGGAAGGAGGRGLPGAPGSPRGGGNGGGPGAAAPTSSFTGPGAFSFGDDVLNRQTAAGVSSMKPGGTPGAPPAAGGGVGASPRGGGASMGGGNTATAETVYTRWVYNRQGVKYGFILDKYNRVVQCEAIGLTSGKAKTRRGITFGSSFASIIKKYGAPDGYEVGGNTIIVRYLNKAKCAFQLSRLADNKPHVVTGIVVAAGKR